MYDSLVSFAQDLLKSRNWAPILDLYQRVKLHGVSIDLALLPPLRQSEVRLCALVDT